MEFKDLPMPFQEMAANVIRSQLATLDLSTVEKETIDIVSMVSFSTVLRSRVAS